MKILVSKSIKDIVRPVKRRVLCVLGKDFYWPIEKGFPLEFHGSDYGGWNIITGRLKPDSVVLSFGIGHDISFDSNLIDKYDCYVVGYDPDPRAWASFENKKMPDKFSWIRKGVAATSGYLTFYPPTREDYMSGTILPGQDGHKADGFNVELVGINEIIETYSKSGQIEVVKMDIEGAEYEVIDALMKTNAVSKINQLLVEFHHCMGSITIEQSKSAIKKLENAGFGVADVSKVGREYLFYNKATVHI